MKAKQRLKQLLSLVVAFTALIAMAYYYRRVGEVDNGMSWILTAATFGAVCIAAFMALGATASWARISVFKSDEEVPGREKAPQMSGLKRFLTRMTFVIFLLWSLSLIVEMYHILFYESGFDPVRLGLRMGLSLFAAFVLVLFARQLTKTSVLSRKNEE